MEGLVKSWLDDEYLRPLGQAFRKALVDRKLAVEADVDSLATLEGIGAVLEAAQGLGWPAALEILQAAQGAQDGGAQDGEALQAASIGRRILGMPDAWGSDAAELEADAAQGYRERWARENAAVVTARPSRLEAQRRSGGRVMPMPSDD